MIQRPLGSISMYDMGETLRRVVLVNGWFTKVLSLRAPVCIMICTILRLPESEVSARKVGQLEAFALDPECGRSSDFIEVIVANRF